MIAKLVTIMSFDNLYKELDSLNKIETDKKNKCCDQTSNYLYNDGIVCCSKCNNTITNIIDSPEWRYYGNEDTKNGNPSRCGMPVNNLLPNSSVGTTINNKGDFNNNKLVLYQNWNSMPYKERSKYKVFNEIDNKCAKNNLPPIIRESAKSLYSNISATKISRGNNRIGIIAACVYHACKECGVPRSIQELSNIFDIDSKIMTKGCKKYTEILRMNKKNVQRIQNIKSINLNDFIERFCYNLDIEQKHIQNIIQISKHCTDLQLTYDNTPQSMGAACIYLYIKLNHLNITKKNISDSCNISEVTINKCCKKLEDNTKLIQIITNIS